MPLTIEHEAFQCDICKTKYYGEDALKKATECEKAPILNVFPEYIDYSKDGFRCDRDFLDTKGLLPIASGRARILFFNIEMREVLIGQHIWRGHFRRPFIQAVGKDGSDSGEYTGYLGHRLPIIKGSKRK